MEFLFVMIAIIGVSLAVASMAWETYSKSMILAESIWEIFEAFAPITEGEVDNLLSHLDTKIELANIANSWFEVEGKEELRLEAEFDAERWRLWEQEHYPLSRRG